MEVTKLDKELVYIAILELWKKFMPEKVYGADDIGV